MAVGGDRDPGLRRYHPGNGDVGGEGALDRCEGAPEAGAVGTQPLRVDNDLQPVGAGAAEFGGDLLADRDRLRAERFPAGAGEGGLDPGGEEPEGDGEQRPDREDGAAVGGRKAPQPPDRSE